MSSIVSVKNLSKKFGDFTAVRDISFDVTEGSVFAFLGANGAGKTTTIHCLTTLTKITSGSVIIAGHTVGEEDNDVRRDIGVVFQQSLLDPLLTVRENLLSRGGLYGLSSDLLQRRIAILAEKIDLKEILDKPYGPLSGGQKRRCDIARALLHEPKVLFLDEPTAGLDPKSREQVWGVIDALRKDTGLTVFLTTHYMEETERADMICVLKRGAIVAQGQPAQLRAQYANDQLTVIHAKPAIFVKNLQKKNITFTQKKGVFLVFIDGASAALKLLKEQEEYVKDFEFRHGSMDDVFLELAEEKL